MSHHEATKFLCSCCAQGVKPVDGGETAKSTDTVGIWHHVFNSDKKISNIWFLRQLSHDELESKVRHSSPCAQLARISKMNHAACPCTASAHLSRFCSLQRRPRYQIKSCKADKLMFGGGVDE